MQYIHKGVGLRSVLILKLSQLPRCAIENIIPTFHEMLIENIFFAQWLQLFF
jgi:hypothetical protein